MATNLLGSLIYRKNVTPPLPGFSIKKVSDYQPLLLELNYNRLPRCARCSSKNVRKKDLSQQFERGKGTIERWYHRRYQIENREQSNKLCPTVLGIDEHFFNRKEGFATTLCDLRKHKIFDIVKGRSERDLAQYLSTLQGKERVKVVCMDLSGTYRSIIRKHFPNANIVADRFHVIRLIQHQCMMTYRTLSSQVKSNRGVLALLRTRPDNLTPSRKLSGISFLLIIQL